MMECADKEFKANSVFFRQHFFYRIASCFYWTMNDVIKFFLGFPQGIFSRVYLNYSISFYFGFFSFPLLLYADFTPPTHGILLQKCFSTFWASSPGWRQIFTLLSRSQFFAKFLF